MIHRSSNDLHFRQVTTLLRRRWLLIVAAGLLGGGLAAGLTYVTEPLYTAKAQLLFEAEMKEGVVVDDAAVETMVEMLLSPSHIRRLAETLAQDPGSPADAGVDAGDSAEEAAAAPPAVALQYDVLEAGLNAYKERQSRLVAVTFTTTDPETAAIVANRAADLYLDIEASYQREQRTRTLRAIADRIPLARADLDAAERSLRAHRTEFGLTDQAVTDTTDKQIAELNRQLMLARSELLARETAIEGLSWNGAPSEASPTRISALPRGGMRVAVTESAVDERPEAGGEGKTDARLAPSAELQRMRLDHDAIAGRISDIESRLATLRRASTDATDSWARLGELGREANAAGQVYENLLRRQDELLGQSGLRPSARLVTTASVPDIPSSPGPSLFIAPALLASLLIGGMLSVILERLDQRLRSETDIDEVLGAPCIGLVPRVRRLHGARMLQLLRDQPFSTYTESIRGIFASVRRSSARGKRSTTLLVTSCEGGEGKTTLLASLAVYAAELRRPVLVIDLDFRNPGLSRVLGESGDCGASEPGLLTALLPQTCIRSAREFGIDYVSLPRTRLDPLSVLEGDEFPRVLARLQETYDYVMIDSGPVLLATETRLLAGMVDHVILTVRWGVTDVRTGQAAIQNLRSAAADFSVVISQVRQRPRRYERRAASIRAPARVAH